MYVDFCRFAKKQGLADLHNVTLPRTGALDVVLEVLGPKSKWAVNGTPSAADARGKNKLLLCVNTKLNLCMLLQAGSGSRSLWT